MSRYSRVSSRNQHQYDADDYSNQTVLRRRNAQTELRRGKDVLRQNIAYNANNGYAHKTAQGKITHESTSRLDLLGKQANSVKTLTSSRCHQRRNPVLYSRSPGEELRDLVPAGGTPV